MKKKLFVISSRIPFPLDKGDKLRLYHQLRFLSEQFEICLCSIDEKGDGNQHLEELKKIVQNFHVIPLGKWNKYINTFLGLFGRKPLQVYYFYQRRAKKQVDNILSDFAPDHIYCQLVRAAEYVKDHHQIKKTIDFQDAFSKGVERRIQHQTWKKFFFKMEHKRLLKYENLIFDYFDFHTIISEEDRNYIFHEHRQRIQIIANGIDADFFSPQAKEKTVDLLFVGNMSYAPNVDSAQRIVREIMPGLGKSFGETRLKIAGSSPSLEVKKLESSRVEVTGWIDDIRDAYASAKLFIAPMRIGSGLQNKLLEAMASGIPVITSKLANRSLKGTHLENVLIGESDDDFCQLIELLLSDPDLYEKIAKNGREYVIREFSWASSVEQLSKFLEQ